MKKIKLISRIFLILGIMVANNYFTFGVELAYTYDMGNDIYLVCSNVQVGPGADNALSDTDDGCEIFIAHDAGVESPDVEIFPNWVEYINVLGYTGASPIVGGGTPTGDPDPDLPSEDDLPPMVCPCCPSTQHFDCECLCDFCGKSPC